MITTADGFSERATSFDELMAKLEEIREEILSGELGPEEIAERCALAEKDYKAMDAILTQTEQVLEKLQQKER